MFLRQLKDQLTSIPGDIRQKFPPMDAGFQLTFLLCAGFLAVLLPFFATKGQGVLLMVIGLLTGLRFFMRPVYRPALAGFLRSRTAWMWLAFTGLALIGALRTQLAMQWGDDTPWLLIKPLLLGLGLLVWAYMRQTSGEPYARFLPPVLLAGVLLFLGLWTFENLKNLLIFQMNGSALPGGVPFYIGLVIEKNTALVLMVPFVFLGGLYAGKKPAVFLHLLLALWVIAVSFITIGAHGQAHPRLMHVASESVQAGMILALCLYLLALALPRMTTHLFFTGLLGMVILSPWIFQWIHTLLEPRFTALGVSMTIRLELWKAAADEALKAPFFGQGMQYLNYGMGEGLTVFHLPYGFTRDHPHPHNMFLQLWINLGGTGVLLVSGIVLSAWRFFLNLPASRLPPLLAALCLTSILAMTTHSLWQPYKISMMALVFLNIYIQGMQLQKK